MEIKRCLHFCAVAVLLMAASQCHAMDAEDTRARDQALDALQQETGKPLEKVRVKELQALLSERGVECKACSEKADLIQRVKETIHLPVKGAAKDGESRAEARAESSGGGRASSSASAGSSHASATSGSGDDAPEDIKEILENLKRSQDPAASDDDTPQNIKDILAKLKKSGGDYKVFGKDDLKKMQEMGDFEPKEDL